MKNSKFALLIALLIGITPVAIAAKTDVPPTGDSAVDRANLYTALAQSEVNNTLAQAIAQPKPQFPASERSRYREGWVFVDFTINADGSISESNVRDSSGSDAFNKAALTAVRKWHFHPAKETRLTVLVNFVYERAYPRFRRSFISRYKKIHTAIDNGDLGEADKILARIRKSRRMTAFELAYSYIAEGRIAAERGDSVEQLRCFRKAMLNKGRWVGDDNTYRNLLYAAVVLEIQKEDYASALRDYALLTESASGRKTAENLEDTIHVISTMVENDNSAAPPFMVADLKIDVERERLHKERYSESDWTRQSNSIEEREYQRMKEYQDRQR